MQDENEEYSDTPPSHYIYEGKDLIYIKNRITSNTLAISLKNLSMTNISPQTLKNVSNLKQTKAYGILGIANFKKIPCLIYGPSLEVIVFYLDEAAYVLKDIKYIPLNQCERNEIQEVDKEFAIFKKNILKTHLIFSNHFDLTMPYYQQNGRNLNEVNSYLNNYEMIKPFLLNNNIKNKNDFYTIFVDGTITCYSHGLSGEQTLLFILFRKHNDMDYYECEITVRFSTDVFNYICGIKIGKEQFNANFIKVYERTNGLIFNCSDYFNENDLKKYLPYFNYIKYNEKNLSENSIKNFINEQNKEIKKTQYYFTCKDPLTGKTKSKYKQQESSQNGSCIFIFNDNESMIKVIKYFNIVLFMNYFSQYQKEKDFKKQNNDFIQLKQINKIEYFYDYINSCLDTINEYLKKYIHFDYKKYLYNNTLNNSLQKTNLENFKLFIGTYNVSAIDPNTIISKFDVTSFLFPKKFSNNISNNNLPDIIYICFEEIVELNPNNILLSSNQEIIDLYTRKITTEISKHYPYILKQQKNLVGVLALLYIKSELNDQIDNLTVDENKTGNLGLGNKGNFIFKFKLNNKEFALCNGHLSAGEKKENFDKRISEIREIFDNVYSDQNENNLYFISGDLNFRIELPKEKFNEICGGTEGNVDEKQAKAQIDILKQYDQMNIVRDIFKKEQLYEEKIRFPPTYKYNKMSTTYNGKRTPSWTDRILFKYDKNINCLFYDTIDLYISDHKPLVGLFEINLK